MKYVAYYRVSTDKQANSGLGLEAQRAAAHRFADGSIICEFVECESGRKSNRPQLNAAIQSCKNTGATLLVAKLDRLARNVLFIAQVMESGVDFIACDMPNVNRFTVHILAAVAEEESRLISERTKAALAARKARGLPVGGYRGRTPKENDNLPTILVLHRQGLKPPTISRKMQELGYGVISRHTIARWIRRHECSSQPQTC